MKLTEVKCPCCEGNAQIKINQKEAKCNYCDTVFLVSNSLEQNENKNTKVSISDKKAELLKRAANYSEYYYGINYEIYRLNIDLELHLFKSGSEYDASMKCPKIYTKMAVFWNSNTIFSKTFYKDVEVNKKTLEPGYYQSEYQKWLNDNKDLYTKLQEIEKKLRELEKNPISLKKDKHNKITSSKEEVTFLTENNSNDFDTETVDKLEKDLSVRIDDLKFTRIELLFFSKKKEDAYNLKEEFSRLRSIYIKGKRLKRRSEVYETLSPSEIEFLNNWLDLRNLVIRYGEVLYSYLRTVEFCIENHNSNLDEKTNEKLEEYEKVMEEIKNELDKSNLFDIVRETYNQYVEQKEVKKIS